jgi:hypothetical protein
MIDKGLREGNQAAEIRSCTRNHFFPGGNTSDRGEDFGDRRIEPGSALECLHGRHRNHKTYYEIVCRMGILGECGLPLGSPNRHRRPRLGIEADREVVLSVGDRGGSRGWTKDRGRNQAVEKFVCTTSYRSL